MPSPFKSAIPTELVVEPVLNATGAAKEIEPDDVFSNRVTFVEFPKTKSGFWSPFISPICTS